MGRVGLVFLVYLQRIMCTVVADIDVANLYSCGCCQQSLHGQVARDGSARQW